MIPKECKRLAEVDFPIAEVSRHSAREKSIRHGHPSTLHLWWARRPLASCRAMLMALLLPDPCDSHCPDEFKTKARGILLNHPNHPRGWSAMIKSDEGLRKVILEFIADFANWDRSSDADYLKTGRNLVRAAHPGEPPLVVDPFAGGGSIPLEALRLGCEAFASDLNPVACLILKVMLEDIPRNGKKLSDEIRRIGEDINKKLESKLKKNYPEGLDSSKPIAYLWARTVQCEAPNCGAEIPLIRSFWLSKKPNRKKALRYKIIKFNNKPKFEFEIFEPKSEREVPAATVSQAKAKCLCCSTVLSPERLKAQLSMINGGTDPVLNNDKKRIGGSRLLAVIEKRKNVVGFQHRLPTEKDIESVLNAKYELDKIESLKLESGLYAIPDEDREDSAADRVKPYGVLKFRDLHTIRQILSLVYLSDIIREINNETVRSVLTLLLGRCVDYWNSGTVWERKGEFIKTYGLQVVAIAWDFVEAVPYSKASGGFLGAVDWVARVIEKASVIKKIGQVEIADACAYPLPDDSLSLWFTDPPYYDAIRYADLSDRFFVWHKRVFNHRFITSNLFVQNRILTPKENEIVQDQLKFVNNRPKDKTFFEKKITLSFSEGRRCLREDGIGCIVFAHSTTEGWEAFLTGIIDGGWTITGSWPIATERSGRPRSYESAALATSVHLICRPRSQDSPVGDWASVLQELPKRVGNLMERLQNEGVRGADLVFACIGPALEIFSRYHRVETPDGKEVTLAYYFEKVWEVVGRTALEQVLGTEEARARNSAAGALEEDARLTALFLWTLQSTNGDQDAKKDNKAKASKAKSKGYSLIFDVARRFAQPLGINLPKWEGRVIETKKGVVRLLPVSERSKQLFGQEDARAVAYALEHEPKTDPQLLLFPDLEAERIPKVRGRGRRRSKKGIVVDSSFEESPEATTLDRVHAAMLLQSGGQANALRAMIKAEQERGPDFLRLANALSALYPKGSEEKRLVDAMLLAVPR